MRNIIIVLALLFNCSALADSMTALTPPIDWPESVGAWYPIIPGAIGVSASGAYSATGTYCMPFDARDSIHIDEIEANMTTGVGSSGTNFAFYNDAVDTNGRHYPKAAYLTGTAQVDTGAAAMQTYPMSTATAIPQGRNWLCFQAGDTTVRMDGISNSTVLEWYAGTQAASIPTPDGTITYSGGTYNTFQTNSAYGTTQVNSQMPFVKYHVYSNP